MFNFVHETYYFDYSHPVIQELINPFKDQPITSDLIQAVYTKVRDSWRYNPFEISLNKEQYKASFIAQKPDGHCIDKSILLITCYRALGIPARLRLAKVANHIAVEALIKKLGSNELAPHGIVEVYFNQKWTKASPAFNKELCTRYKVDILDFDGTYDSIFQEYNHDNHQFMEYLEDYGAFDDVPLVTIEDIFIKHYPHFVIKT